MRFNNIVLRDRKRTLWFRGSTTCHPTRNNGCSIFLDHFEGRQNRAGKSGLSSPPENEIQRNGKSNGKSIRVPPSMRIEGRAYRQWAGSRDKKLLSGAEELDGQ